MNDEVVKRLLVEIDGNVEKLRRELRAGEQQVQQFAGKANQAGKVAGDGADALASKQANAARAIASATETIARQGQVSGEAAKQLLTQGSNLAFMFGPQGAIVGAVGIATLAIVGLFSRTREEVAATRREAVDAMNAFADLDSQGMARGVARSFSGGVFKQATDDIFAESDAARRRAILRSQGSVWLEAEARRLEAEQRQQQAQPVRTFAEGGAADAVAREETARRVQEVTAALAELRREQEQQIPLLVERQRLEREAKAAQDAQRDATKGAAEAERERARALEELAAASARLGGEVLERSLEALGTAAARAAQPFDALISQAQQLAASGVDVAANLERAEALERLRDRAVAAAEALASAEAVIARVEQRRAAGSTLGVQDSTALSLEIGRQEQRIKTLKVGTAEYEKQVEVLKKLLALRTAIDPPTPGQRTAPPPDVREFADVARELQQAADGALQLAANLGGASESATALLRSVVQIVGNLPALQQALDPGPGKSISALSVAGAALPILGALSSLGASLFGDSPEEQARRRIIEENTEALQELTKKVGLLGIDVEGADALRAQEALARFIPWFEQRERASGANELDARAMAKGFGLSLKELDEIARQHGITLGDSITSFRQLQLALADTITKLGEFGDDLDSQRRQADAEIDILGVTDPAQQLAIRLGAFRGRSPALDRVLAGFDPNSAESRQAARQAAIELFTVLRAGGDRLGAGELGGLTGDDLLEALRQLISGLDAIETAAGTAVGSNSGTVTGFRSLTEATGSQLVDYARAAQQTRLQMLAALVRLAGEPLPVPPISGSVSGAPAVRVAAPTVTVGPVQVTVHLHFPDVTDATDVADAAGVGVRRGVEEALYEAIVRASRAAGDLRIYPGLG